MERHRHPMARLRRAFLAALLVVAPVTFVAGPPAEAQSQPDPILFVHGWNSSGSTWNTMVSRFQAAGYPSSHLRTISYNSNQTNVQIANQVRAAADQLRADTGASRIDIITHSMGGLSSRYYLKFLGGTAHVDDWVSLGGPNHGTSTAYACWLFSTSCRDMTPGSGILNNLNSGNPVPGPTNYATWWSPCDAVILPNSSTSIPGATNTQTACVGHTNLQNDQTLFNQVLAFVN
jgi:triacylglycerol lipase